MKINIIGFNELTDQEKQNAPNNGSGKEYANYLKVEFEDGTIFLESDAMEPEDATLTRDLYWIVELLELINVHYKQLEAKKGC